MIASDTEPMAAFIDGARVLTVDALDVRSPYTGELVGRVSIAGRPEAERAVDAAARAMTEPLPAWRRAELLDRIAAVIDERAEELAQLICAEAGKPIKAARLEARRGAGTYRLAAAEARRLAGDGVPVGATQNGEGHLGFTVRVPIGVVGAITPFNFPLNLVAHKTAPALAAGCAVVLKPAEKTPLTALQLARVCADAGLPAGWLNVLCGRPAEIADVFVEDDRVRMISFTGSDRVGWDLHARARRKKVALELGNMSPLIVDTDADLDVAASKVARHAFGYAGQTCVSVQRVLVHHTQLDTFVSKLVAEVDALVVGDPADDETDVGPLIDADATARVAAWINEAVDGGATVLAGGGSVNGCLAPTVLTDVPADSQLACREVFGPVCAIATFDQIDDAFEVANSTPFGLQAGVFTNSIATAMRAAHCLEFGSVMINEAPEWRADEIPYGGVKASGNTKEGPMAAIREMTQERLVVIAVGS
jgi:acyl-CoA reductase-like NAD-dependent aldehyde dehydrogenase